jgi:hypothetical protein
MPTCPDDSFLDILLQAVGALATGHRDLANAKATELAVDLPVERSRVPITPRLTASVMRRDFFSCRYCDARIIPVGCTASRFAGLAQCTPVPGALEGVSNTPAVPLPRRLDRPHRASLARGGDTEALTNLATACWGCNVQKSDLSLERLGWQLQTHRVRSAWDGLVGFYPALWNVAQSNATEEDVRFHSKWLPAFRVEQRPVALKMRPRNTLATLDSTPLTLQIVPSRTCSLGHRELVCGRRVRSKRR